MGGATKRSFDELDSRDPDSGSPEPQTNDARSNSKRPKHGNHGKGKAKEGSQEWSRKRVRNIERLFQKNQELPANVRNDLQRELAAHKTTIADKSFQKKRSAMISKYHMVRFFERKKASRLVKQYKKQIDNADDSEDITQLQRRLHIAQVDEAYTQHFPHIETYISLYPNTKSGDADDDTKKTPIAKAAIDAERPPMWSTIETAMGQGRDALNKIRERRSTDDSATASKPNRPRSKAAPAARPEPVKKQPTQPADRAAAANNEKLANPALNRRERRKLMRKMGAVQPKEDDDGEGFFEEG